MHSDVVVVVVALGVAAGAMLVGLGFAAWISGRRPVPEPPASMPVAVLPPSVTDGVAPKQLRVLAQELSAHADTTAAQATRAKSALAAARAALTAAETVRAAAEAEFDAARRAYDAALRSLRAGQPDAQTEARERQVSRAALDAYRRGELSVEGLRTVFGQADPSPEREQRVREADRLALVESQARRAFQQAVAAARIAREELHVVEVAEAAVREEAAEAALEAQEAAIAVRAAAPRRRRRPR